MRSRKHTEKKTREAIRKQLQYLRRDLSIVDSMLQSGLKLPQSSSLGLKHSKRFTNSRSSCMTIIHILFLTELSV